MICLALGLAIHGGAPAARAEPPAAMRVGLYQNPPKIFVDGDGEPAGLFADVVAVLASEFGWKVDYVRCRWSDCLDKLAAGDIDIMPDVAHTQERAHAFAFGQVPVLQSWSYLYSDAGNVIQNLADIQGKRLAVLEDSIQHNRLRDIRANRNWTFEIVPTATHTETLVAVADGRADVGVVNHFFGEPQEARFDLARSQIVFQPTSLYFAFANSVPDDVIEMIDAKVAELKSTPDSAYFAAYERWVRPTHGAAVPDWLYWLIGAILLALAASFGTNALLKRRISQATEALKRSQEKLIEAQFLARVGDFSWDLTTDRVEWSDGMRALLGYDSDEPVDLALVVDAVHHPDDSDWVMQWIQDGIDGDATTLGPRTYRLRRKDGEVIFVEANLRIERERGKAVRVFGTCHDITRQVTIENALQATMREAEEASRAKTDFLASMSHELRTPLNAIIGFSEILHANAASALAEPQRRQIENIRIAGDQLLDLVNDILDVSSAEAGEVRVESERVEVAEVVRESIEQLDVMAARAGVTIDNEIDDRGPAPAVRADRARLKQIVLNFLSNAVKFNRPQGHVTVTAAPTGDGFLRLAVADTGIGVPPEKHRQIFDIFSRLHGDPMVAGGGAGVGLTVAKRLVERMGGRIGVDSRPGDGSTFWCDLPLAETAPALDGVS